MSEKTALVSKLVKASGGFVNPELDGVIRTMGRSGALGFTVGEAHPLLNSVLSVKIEGTVTPQVAMQIAALIDGYPTHANLNPLQLLLGTAPIPDHN